MGIPKTFRSMLFSPASMSAYSLADASGLISFTSIKSTTVDVWTANKADFKTYETENV